ncbi:very short patch repair endonuclease [Alcaligenes faecalis]|uniref:very short patch repair endonuclease n=1 Tax=Alcaligenes faecalis TaxID=511 RepID=UPI002180C63B|nr:very short patch repair endonuclease [Alcaligenes faecalis]
MLEYDGFSNRSQMIIYPTKASPEKRSRMMAGIKGKNTKLEMFVRRLVRGMGFRFWLHKKDLPGSPDLVFPGLKRVIFCAWLFLAQASRMQIRLYAKVKYSVLAGQTGG